MPEANSELNVAAGATGETWFPTVIAPLSPQDFIRDYWNREMLHIAGAAGRFHDLASWDDVSALLSHHRLEPPRFQLVHRGRDVSTDQYMRKRGGAKSLDAGAVTAKLAQGATMILSFIDEMLPMIARLADGMEEVLRGDVNVNLYAGWRADPGFELHWDPHDVFILQVRGRKRWRLYQPTIDFPVRTRPAEPKRPDGPPDWEEVLEDGAMLYIPRGWWHDAAPLNEPTLHLTVAVIPPTARDFLNWFSDRVEGHLAGRRDIPRAAGAAEIERYFDELRAVMLSEWNSETIARFFALQDSRRPARAEFRLPWLGGMPPAGMVGTTRVRLASAQRLEIFPAAGGEIRFTSGIQEWRCDAALAPALSALRSFRDRSFDDLCALLPAFELEAKLRKQLLLLAASGAAFLDLPQ